MRTFLIRNGIKLSKTTVHRYMNKELGLTFIVKRKKGKACEIFSDMVMQEFTNDMPNKIWCTDFTYLFLKRRKRYNCSIIDFYDRSVVASITGKEITSTPTVQILKRL